MRYFSFAGVAIGAACVFCSITAQATLVSSSFVLPTSTPSWYVQDYFTPIDPTLYKINSVDLNLGGNIYGNVQIQNLDIINSGGVIVAVNGTITIYFADQSQISLMPVAAAVETGTLTPYAGSQYFSDSSSLTNPSLMATASLDTVITNPTSLNYFYNTGAGFLFLVGMDYSTITTDLSIQSQLDILMDTSMTITINYSPIAAGGGVGATDVPEPSALAVFGIGLLGLGFVFRNRRPT